jgi:hypothetical protein
VTDLESRQVQDLQSQIAELTQLNTHLRTKGPDGGVVDAERPETKRRHSEVQDDRYITSHRMSAPAIEDFDHVRENIRNHSEQRSKTPHGTNVAATVPRPVLPDLPPRADFARLSRSYIDHFHEWYPVFHWPTFQGEVDEVYTARSFKGMSCAWISMFYATMACGSLQAELLSNGIAGPQRKGVAYFEAATQLLSPWPRELTIVHAQVALLLSIFAEECSMGSVGSMWLACAVRAAQELKVYSEVSYKSFIETETRRRLWWAIYVRDRYALLSSAGHRN